MQPVHPWRFGHYINPQTSHPRRTEFPDSGCVNVETCTTKYAMTCTHNTDENHNYYVTPWSINFIEKPPMVHLIKKQLPSYGTQSSSILTLHLSQSNQKHTEVFPYTPISSKCSVPLRFWDRNVCIFVFHACYMSLPSQYLYKRRQLKKFPYSFYVISLCSSP